MVKEGSPKNKRMIIIGVMGGHLADGRTLSLAEDLGRYIAGHGYVLLTGGGPGVMEAASRGAHDSGGLVIGMLPSDRAHPKKGYPNKYVDIPIYTGMQDARNVINAKTPDVVVALEGSYGTISEIALALNAGTPVISIDCPEYDHFRTSRIFTSVSTVKEAVMVMERLISCPQK